MKVLWSVIVGSMTGFAAGEVAHQCGITVWTSLCLAVGVSAIAARLMEDEP